MSPPIAAPVLPDRSLADSGRRLRRASPLPLVGVAMKDFFAPHPHPVLPTLAELRDIVLEQNRKRRPKWGFRLASDLIVQLQPMNEGRRLFAGVAIDGPTDVTSFDGRPKTAMPWFRLRFEVVAYGEFWAVRAQGWRATRSRCGEAVAVWDRVRGALSPETFAVFRPELMLSGRCLCCGKALTDPASLARWFGPECAGTSSLRVPRLYLPGLEAVS